VYVRPCSSSLDSKSLAIGAPRRPLEWTGGVISLGAHEKASEAILVAHSAGFEGGLGLKIRQANAIGQRKIRRTKRPSIWPMAESFEKKRWCMTSKDQAAFDAIAARCQALAREREQEEIAKVPAIAKETSKEEQEIGFSARLLVQATLPHSKPAPGVTEFQRTNGFVTIHIQAPEEYGLPYGTYPRLLLAWVTTEAVRTKSPELELGDSLRQFMRKLDLEVGGGPRGSAPRLRQHMQRLFTSTVSATYQEGGQWIDVGFRPIEKAHIFWDPKSPTQVSLWRSAIRLNQMFYDEIVRRPVPVDMHVLRGLAKTKSPLAIDIYQWITHRMSYLRDSTTIPWEALALQFGGDYGRKRDFRTKFLCHLKQVLELYPQAKVEPVASGLKLLQSRPHVPIRVIRGRRA